MLSFFLNYLPAPSLGKCTPKTITASKDINWLNLDEISNTELIDTLSIPPPYGSTLNNGSLKHYSE